MRVVIPMEQLWHRVPGGTARATIDFAHALQSRPEVDVVGVSAWHRHPPAPEWRTSVPITAHPLPEKLLYEAWHGLRRPIVEGAVAAGGPVDVVHNLGGATAATHVPLVATVHDLAFLHHPGMFTHHGLRFLRRALTLIDHEAAAILVPSQATLEDCATAGIERGRLHLVPWGIGTHTVDVMAVDAVRRRFGLDGDYAVAVGTLEPRKNLPRLLDAWRAVERDGRRLVVIGPAGWGEAIDPARVPASVVVTGFVDAATRDALYAGATVSAYPSLFEGFGLPVLESMALGCPVVTSTGTSTEELVADGGGIAVDPADVDAIAGALAEILDSPSRRADLSIAGRAVASTFTWDRAVDTTLAVYRDVA